MIPNPESMFGPFSWSVIVLVMVSIVATLFQASGASKTSTTAGWKNMFFICFCDCDLNWGKFPCRKDQDLHTKGFPKGFLLQTSCSFTSSGAGFRLAGDGSSAVADAAPIAGAQLGGFNRSFPTLSTQKPVIPVFDLHKLKEIQPNLQIIWCFLHVCSSAFAMVLIVF